MDLFFVKHQKKWPWVVSLAVFALSLAYSFYFQIQPIVDARAYDNIALEILKGNGYPLDANNRPGPGYEYFLAGIYSLFGHSYPAVWVVQSLLLALTAVLIFKISESLFGASWHPLTGVAAAMFVGLSPDLITISAMLMTETLLIFLTVLSAFFFFRHLSSGRFLFLPPAGVFIGLAVLVRGNVILAVLPMLILLAFREKLLKKIVVFSAALILTLLPWTLRNFSVYGQPTPFSASPGLLYVGNHPGATGELIPNYPLPPGVNPAKMSQIEFDTALGKAGRDYVLSHPLEFLKLTALRLSIYFSFARPFAFWPHLAGWAKAATAALSSFYAAAIFTLGSLGVFWALKRGALEEGARQRAIALFGMFAMMPLSVAALIVETRYRLPAYPFLAVFAGYAVYSLFANREILFKEVKKIAVVGGLFVANTVFDVIRNFQRILERLS